MKKITIGLLLLVALIPLAVAVEEEHEEIAPGVSLELDEKGRLLGVEILHASKVLGVKPKIKEKILESI